MDAEPRDRVLLDRYELGELLGRGGMGEVYVGHDRVLGRQVAIKMVAGGGAASDGELAQRLLGEARAAASIEHPNVVRVHDLTITEATIFVVMEYLEGESLAQRLSREERLPVEDSVRIAADVCLGLAAAHQAGVIPRDVGPGNIMLCADETVKVMDFGIARIADSGIQTAGGAMGTPGYVAPEQAGGSAVDERADLYSLGCTLYHMLTGQPPFTGSGPVEVAWQQRHATPRPPGTRRPDLPATVEAVVLKALAKSPRDRFDDALQMRAVLMAALDPGTAQEGQAAVEAAVHDAGVAAVPTVHGASGGHPPGLPPTGPADLPQTEPRPPVRTYRPGVRIDWAEVDATGLDDAAADRRRRRVGVGLILLGLLLLTLATFALTGAT
jgi:eukaryotic-like serine/threonine-protein kinase